MNIAPVWKRAIAFALDLLIEVSLYSLLIVFLNWLLQIPIEYSFFEGRGIGAFNAADGLMLLRIERLSDWINQLQAVIGGNFQQLLVGQVKAVAQRAGFGTGGG